MDVAEGIAENVRVRKAYADKSGGSSPNPRAEGKDGTSLKPGIPLLFPLALALWATCAGTYTLLESADRSLLVVTVIVAALCAIIAGIVLVRARHAHIVGIILGAALGVCCASYGSFLVCVQADAVDRDAQAWVFELTEDTSSATFGTKAAANARNATGTEVRVELYFNDGADRLCGDCITANMKLSAVSDSSESYYRSRGIAAVAYVKDYEDAPSGALSFLRDLRKRTIEAFAAYGGNEAGILQALVCGYRNTIKETSLYDDFRCVGLAHIVAVSGAHLAIVIGAFEWLLRRLKVGHIARIAICITFTLAYLVFAGIPISALRAAFMVILSLSASVAHRRSASLNAASLCIIAFIAIDPTTALSASFFLSAGSTIGIILFARLIASWMDGLPRRLHNIVAEPIGLTLASNIVTQPYSAALFSQLPLLSVPANVLAAPFFTLACVVGLASAVLSCMFTGGAMWFVTVASFAAMPLESVVGLLAAFPYASIALDVPTVPMVVFSVVLCFVLWIAWPRFSIRILVGATAVGAVGFVAIVVISPSLTADEIIMLDVGQGDAFVIRSQGSAVLIDTGNQDSMLRSALGRQGIYDLDGVFISHSDDDHYGSLPVLNGIVNVDGVYVTRDTLTCGCDSCERLLASAGQVVDDDAIYGLSVGDIINVGHFTIEVIWPEYFVDEGENSDSMCLSVTLDCDRDGTVDWTSFFCGDAESEQLNTMVSNGSLGEVDVLKVGHHGSRVALTEELAEQLSPSIALISVGANNRYGHPTDEVLEYLENVDASVLRTDELGDVKLTFSTRAIEVS